MKYLVLSFDDATVDFYTNVMPILKKYKVNATLNVITGFSDNSFKHVNKIMDFNQIKEADEAGIEIAMHSDSHSRNINLRDYQICFDKLSNVLGIKQYGMALPFNQVIPQEILDYAKDNGLYIQSGETYSTTFIERLLLKLNVKKSDYYFFQNNTANISRKNIVFNRIPIYLKREPLYYIDNIKRLSNNRLIILMFHQIYETMAECQNCSFPEGSWTTYYLTELIEACIKEGIKIITMRDYFINCKNV